MITLEKCPWNAWICVFVDVFVNGFYHGKSSFFTTISRRFFFQESDRFPSEEVKLSTAWKTFTVAVKQGFSGTLGRPSTWLSLGKARGAFDISVTPFIEVGGGAFDESILKSSRAVSCYSGIQGVLNNLPTASKIRAQLLTSGTGFAFAVLYLATSCVKYGRLAEKKPAGMTRACSSDILKLEALLPLRMIWCQRPMLCGNLMERAIRF